MITQRITMEVDTGGIVAGLLRAKAFHPAAHRAATLELAEQFVRVMDAYMRVHHDTNRFINGWISALHGVGIKGIPLKRYRRSSRHDQYLELLREQLESVQRIIERDEATIARYEAYDRSAPPRKDGKPRAKRMNQHHTRGIIRRLKKYKKREKRTIRELARAEGTDSIIFFHRRIHGRGRRDFHTVRHKIYGGAGRIFTIGPQLFVELRNLEAHARSVEANPKVGHPVKAAYAALRSFGIRRAGRAYMNKMAEQFGPPKPTDALSVVSEAEMRHAERFAA